MPEPMTPEREEHLIREWRAWIGHQAMEHIFLYGRWPDEVTFESRTPSDPSLLPVTKGDQTDELPPKTAQ